MARKKVFTCGDCENTWEVDPWDRSKLRAEKFHFLATLDPVGNPDAEKVSWLECSSCQSKNISAEIVTY